MTHKQRRVSEANEPLGHYNALTLDFSNYSELKRLDPIVKWPGGKESELKHIIPNLPASFHRYYEPFVGGGSVFAAIEAKEYFINDKSEELIALYRVLQSNERTTFIDYLNTFDNHWEALAKLTKSLAVDYVTQYKRLSKGLNTQDDFRDFANDLVKRVTAKMRLQIDALISGHGEDVATEVRRNVLRKAFRLIDIENDKKSISDMDVMRTLETSIKGSYYMLIRNLYNRMTTESFSLPLRSALFFFIRNYTYSGMFRYNSSGEFNVPYGGMAYNSKSFSKKIEYFLSTDLTAKLERTIVEEDDFEAFLLKHEPRPGDFIFLDPPYDSEFSTYAKNEFTAEDHRRLASYLIQGCQANWMMIIKRTPLIEKLYRHPSLRIGSFDKTYLVSFMNRNDKEAEHMVITNY